MSTYKQPEAGEWYRVYRRYTTIVCCDCGLVHRTETKVVNREIWQRAWRSEAQTAGKRSAKKRARKGVFKTWKS